MKARYSKQYIEKALHEKDAFSIEGVLMSVIGNGDQLPKYSDCFLKISHWFGLGRNGVWQYYEVTPIAEQKEVLSIISSLNIPEVEKWYKYGMAEWQNEEKIGALDTWLNSESRTLKSKILELVIREGNEIEKLCS